MEYYWQIYYYNINYACIKVYIIISLKITGGRKYWIKKQDSKVIKLFISLLFIVYLIVLINVIVLKCGRALSVVNHSNQISFSQKIGQINFIPLANTIIPYLEGELSIRIAVINLLGNIIAFIPLGLFLSLLFKKYVKIKNAFWVSFTLSMLIEVVQLVFSIGYCDIDDVILNVFGSLLGVVLYYLFRNLLKRRVDVVQ